VPGGREVLVFLSEFPDFVKLAPDFVVFFKDQVVIDLGDSVRFLVLVDYL
jgi:hypothetical protein